MSYKTILVHLDEAMLAKERLSTAAEIALAHDAHLVGSAIIGRHTFNFQQARIEEKDPVLAKHIDFLIGRAQHYVDAFDEAMRKMCVPSFEGRVVDGEANYALSLQAHYCDLVIISQAFSEKHHHVLLPDFSEFVLLHAGCPVLMLPKEWRHPTIGKRVLIAWNGSSKATRAINDAIPMLKRAEQVQIAVFNVQSNVDLPRNSAGHDIACSMARHDVNVEVLPPRKTPDVGMGLLAMAEELSCDLLVMGGYGHSRLREKLLGGVTHTILRKMNLPVLMSH